MPASQFVLKNSIPDPDSTAIGKSLQPIRPAGTVAY